MQLTATALRRNFAEVLKAVAAGDVVSVTKHGKVVATIATPPAAVDAVFTEVKTAADQVLSPNL